MRASDEKHIAPGAATIGELFGGHPTLILLDEVSVYLQSIDCGDKDFRAGLYVHARRGDGILIFAAHLDFPSAKLRAALAAERLGGLFQVKARRRRALSGARSRRSALAAKTVKPDSRGD